MTAALTAVGLPQQALAAPTSGSAVHQVTPTPAGDDVRAVCAEPKHANAARCLSLQRTDVVQRRGVQPMSAEPQGYGPADIRDAYDLPDTGGDGMTVAIVDAFDAPTAEADLAVWREQYGLPPCTTGNGCFRKIDQRGGTDYPPPDSDWAVEIALDLDAVSATCPACDILLVEADDNFMDNLGAAVSQAVAQGADVVSNSYGGDEDPLDSDFDDLYYDHPGVAITASSGDFGYGVSYPAASPYVTSVGGTALVRDADTERGWSESVWNDHSGHGPGSGCSQYGDKPAWQADEGCSMRTVADVSAVADPATGLSVYETFSQDGWTVVGGTSLAAPLVAGVYALGGKPGSGEYPSSYAYARSGALNDVTEGDNGTCSPAYLCTAGPGYDGPTGLGTPHGVAAFAPLGPHGEVTGTVTDADSGEPIAGAAVSAGDARDTTDTAGHYDLVLPVGDHDVRATVFGYSGDTTSVTVAEDETVHADFTLSALPSVTVHGRVTEGSRHGWPLYATVTVDGMPDGTFHTDPASGKYSITLPANATYTFTVDADYPGITPQSRTVRVGDTDRSASFRLVADPYACTAPGYQPGETTTRYEQTFDDPTVPSDWTVVDNLDNGQVWRFDDDRNFGNRTGGDGLYAWVFSAGYGPDGQQDTSLVSPPVDMSATTNPAFWFNTDYSPGGQSVGDVDVSVDGGTTWTNVWRRVTTNVHEARVMVPVPQAEGQSDVRVRFHYTASFSGWWMVDNATFGDRACDTVAGGLVVGHVRDRNTGDGLVGATVRSVEQPDLSATTTAMPDDPALGYGYWWMFSPLTGEHALAASMTRYRTHTRTVDVTPDRVTKVNFRPRAGQLTVDGTAVEERVGLGRTARTQLTVRNDGTAPATVRLGEMPGGAEVLAADGTRTATTAAGAPVQRVHGTFSPDAPSTARAAAATGDGAAPAATGPWTPMADYPIRVSYNVAGYHDGKVYSVGGFGAAGALSAGYAYDTLARAWAPIADMPHAREKPAAGFLGDRLYVVGGWSGTGEPRGDMDVYDPRTDSWSQGPAIPLAIAAPGSAVLDGELYVVGGCRGSCGKSEVFRYDPVAQQWEQLADYPRDTAWLACGGIAGKLYCAGGLDGGSESTRTYVYDPAADTWTRLTDLPIDLWGAGYTVADGTLMVSGGVTDGSHTVTNQGFAYHPDTDTWSTLPNAAHAVYGGASACGFYIVGGADQAETPTAYAEELPGYGDCGAADPVEWLSTSRTGLRLQPGESATLTVAFDAGAVDQPGTYTGSLALRSDTPYPTNVVDVTMTATPPHGWGKLTGTVSGAACTGGTAPLPGATVQVDGTYSSWTLATGADGTYAVWMDRRESPLRLTVTRSGWFPETATARVRGGETTVRDVTLTKTECSGD